MLTARLCIILTLIGTNLCSVNFKKLAISHAVFVNNSAHNLAITITIDPRNNDNLLHEKVVIAAHGSLEKKFSGMIINIIDHENKTIEPDHILRDVQKKLFRIILSHNQTSKDLSCLFIPPYFPFELSMGVYYDQCVNAKTGKYLTATKPKLAKTLLSYFQNLYEKYHPAKITPQTTPRIPKIIHQIWLGSTLPEKFKAWQQTWLDKHPDWHFILWTDQDCTHNPNFLKKYTNYIERSLTEFGKLFNQRMYNLANNYGAKADIVRIELLHRYGGLYTDVDVECCEPFDIFNHSYDFYAGIEPLEFLWLSLNNGIIGSIAKHPILDCYMQDIHQRTNFPRAWQTTHLTTGPIAFTKAFWAASLHDTKHINVVFPARFFGPIDRFNNITMWHETYAKQYFTHSWIR